jgi:hypothetical protein
MTTPAYLETFRRAVHELAERGKSEISGKSPTLIPLNPLIPHLGGKQSTSSTPAKAANNPYAEALLALEHHCPDYIEPGRWQQCLSDARLFFAAWGEQAAALGWTAEELLGLHEPPANPHPSYHRLSRYEFTGLIWGLEGRRVVALTATTAAVEGFTGNVTIYRKTNKPALGPLGDSLDDFIA